MKVFAAKNYRLWAKKISWDGLRRHSLIVLGAIAILSVGAAKLWSTSACTYPYKNDQQLVLLTQTIKLEDASTTAATTKGLSGRPCMPYDQGMLFNFQQPGQYGFWMKDTHFPLDMVWLDQNKKVVYLKTNAEPSSFPQTYTNSQAAKYVLELNAGSVAKRYIEPGNILNF